MSEHASNNSRDIPQVILAQRVVDKMVRGALLYPDPETGEALIGLIVPRGENQEPDIYVLDTIGPGEDAVREWGMFEQGNDWQADVFNWLYANWETFRDLRRSSYGRALAAKWDVPLSHVGDWHKQPGDMTAPSPGDAQTARRMIGDSETPVEHIVAPIVTLYPLAGETEAEPDADVDTNTDVDTGSEELSPEKQQPLAAESEPESSSPTPAESEEIQESGDNDDDNDEPVAQNGSKTNTLSVALTDEGWTVRIDFWYMSKRVKRFVPVTPAVWPDDRLPGLPPIAWHLVHTKRFEQELTLLTDAKYIVDVVQWDADGKPPYEICFSAYHPGSKRVILLVTTADYPNDMPAVRLAPLVPVTDDEDMFSKLYEASESILLSQMPGWQWDSKRTLLELIWHVEETFKEKVEPS
ncbi:MAG: hypothetical protein JW966_03660 [Anaerolineae bacterium]|nr:hypothetical protein [Anaerolineae bacterium]